MAQVCIIHCGEHSAQFQLRWGPYSRFIACGYQVCPTDATHHADYFHQIQRPTIGLSSPFPHAHSIEQTCPLLLSNNKHVAVLSLSGQNLF